MERKNRDGGGDKPRFLSVFGHVKHPLARGGGGEAMAFLVRLVKRVLAPEARWRGAEFPGGACLTHSHS
jgi:hypothetical protein